MKNEKEMKDNIIQELISKDIQIKYDWLQM
jgi:hypothetical protein